MNVAGTTVTFPFGDIITFDSKRHFFRGENSQFEMSVPTLNRKIMKMSPIEQELFRAVSNMRIVQFRKFIWNINVVPYCSTAHCGRCKPHFKFCGNTSQTVQSCR